MLTVGIVGGGTVIVGLTPPLSISVAPSGMAPPASNDPGVGPGVESGDAVPVEDTVAEDPKLQPVEDNPPPSKVELAEVVDWVPVPELAAEEQGSELKPPGLISVAPSGIPVGAPEVE